MMLKGSGWDCNEDEEGNDYGKIIIVIMLIKIIIMIVNGK